MTRVKVGDKVAVSPSHACGQCDYCREGREQLCRKMRFLGSASLYPHVQGMFSEFFVMGERQCYPVAGDVTLGELAFAEPLAVALHAVKRGADLVGKSVLITGAGTIGCLTVIAARLAGAKSVTVSDILDRPLAQAREVGADRTLPRRPRRRRARGAAIRRLLRGFGQLRGAQDVRGRREARRRHRAGRHAAARAAAVRRQRADGEGARPQGRVPLGHRVRLGGRLPLVAHASTCGRSCPASFRCRTPSRRSRSPRTSRRARRCKWSAPRFRNTLRGHRARSQ